MKRRSDVRGILLLDKAPGQTSFQSLSIVKRVLGTGRVGHCGTLDKFAEGLMIVLVGSYTRLVPWFTGLDKTYEAKILLGEETDTLDPEGTVIEHAPPPEEPAFRAAIPSFVGAIDQVPPSYSAIHVDGKRAWQRVRDGQTLTMPPRPITIYELSLEAWQPPCANVSVHCSSGTYVRSLARDIARASGSCGRLETLSRSGIGAFSRDDAIRLPESLEESSRLIAQALVPVRREQLEKAGLFVLTIPPSELASVRNGRPLSNDIRSSCLSASGDIALVDTADELVAVLRQGPRGLSYACVMPPPSTVAVQAGGGA